MINSPTEQRATFMVPLNVIATHHSGNSKLIKGKLHDAPTDNLFPAFSATGQDVWRDAFDREGNAIIISAVGARCGKCFLASGRWSAIANTHVVWPDPEKADIKFLWYLLNDEQFWIRSGSAQPFVAVRKTFEKEIFVPPLPDQHRIVAEIEKQFTRLEVGVAALRRVQANLKRYRAAVLKAACEGRLVPTEAELARAEGRPFESGQQLLARILTARRQNWQGRGKYKEPADPDSANLPSLPDSWTWVSWEMVLASDDGAFKRGPFGSALTKAIFVKKGFKVYEQYCPINDDCSFARYYITPEKFEELQSFEVKAGDYLISCSGVTLGRITRVPEQFERGIINQALLRVRINESVINQRYFLHLFRSALFQKTIFDNSTGSAIPNVKGVKELKAMAIPLPPLAEQTRIVAEVERRLSVVEELESVVASNLKRSTRLRQTILQNSFRG